MARRMPLCDQGRDRECAPLLGSLADVWVAAALVMTWVVFTAGSVAPNDLWWHLRAGEWMLAHRTIPQVDLFSYTQAGAPWVYQAWLAEVILAGVHRAGGVALLVAFGAVLTLVGYGLALRAAKIHTGANRRAAALAMLLGMIVGTPAWQVRPQLLSVALFGALMAVLYAGPGAARRAGDAPLPRAAWLLPVGFALWANLHGGFIFGLLALGIQVAAQLWQWLQGEAEGEEPPPPAATLRARATQVPRAAWTWLWGKRATFPWAWVAVGLLSLAATLATPLGTGMVGYVLGFAQHPVTRNLNMEFAPLNARQGVGIAFLVHLGLLVSLWLWRGHRPSIRETLLLLAFGGLTLIAVRGVIWYGLATTPMLARAVAEVPMFRREREQRGVVWMNRTLIGLLGLAAIVTWPWLRGYLPHPAIDAAHPYLGKDTPVAAVAALREMAAEGEVRPFHSEAYGSYLIYAAPEIPVFVDTRIELYPPEQWDDYLAASSARYDWYERLRAYGVNLLLLDKERQADLLEAAQVDGRWDLVYEDGAAAILALR